MEGVYIISDNTSLMKETVQQLSVPETQLIDYEKFEHEEHLHDWITNKFKGRGIKKLILPVAIPTTGVLNSEGLKIVLHLRLNYELSIEERSIPIVLLSDFSLDIIVAKNSFDKDTNPQNLFFTKGVYRASFDCDDIIKKLENTQNITKNEYKQDVLAKLKITKKASEGKHSIANAWGCFKLSLVTGLRKEIFEIKGVSSMLKTMYAKYLICFNDAYSDEKRIDLNPLKCSGKKVLFIDDQSDEGWTVLMKGIFKGAENTFVSVDSSKYKNAETKQFHDFEGFMTECRSHIGKEWDLVIIDLRLNPEKEDIDSEMIPPTEFSGYKLIDEFLNENEGYQIVVSTASNKIWNINAALDRGASSFYIKESPEFNYSVNETYNQYENFKNDVLKCFERTYLYIICEYNSQVKGHFSTNPLKKYFSNNLEQLKAISYQNLIAEELNSSFNTLKTRNTNRFNIAMLSIFKIFECLSEIFIENDDYSVKMNFWDGDEVMFCEYVSQNYNLKKKDNTVPERAYKSTENKIHALLFQKLEFPDFSVHQVVHKITRYRNDYIHPDNRFNLDELTPADIENWFLNLSKILKKT